MYKYDQIYHIKKIQAYCPSVTIWLVPHLSSYISQECGLYLLFSFSNLLLTVQSMKTWLHFHCSNQRALIKVTKRRWYHFQAPEGPSAHNALHTWGSCHSFFDASPTSPCTHQCCYLSGDADAVLGFSGQIGSDYFRLHNTPPNHFPHWPQL